MRSHASRMTARGRLPMRVSLAIGFVSFLGACADRSAPSSEAQSLGQVPSRHPFRARAVKRPAPPSQAAALGRTVTTVAGADADEGKLASEVTITFPKNLTFDPPANLLPPPPL